MTGKILWLHYANSTEFVAHHWQMNINSWLLIIEQKLCRQILHFKLFFQDIVLAHICFIFLDKDYNLFEKQCPTFFLSLAISFIIKKEK